MCVGERFIYLDTSSVLNFGTKLEDKPFFNNIFTSLLTALELVSRCLDSEEEFGKRRRIIKFLDDKYLIKYNTLSDYKKHDALPFIDEYLGEKDQKLAKSYNADLLEIIKLIISCETLSSLHEHLHKSNSVSKLNRLIEYDALLGQKHISVSTGMMLALRDNFEKKGISEFSQAYLSLSPQSTFEECLIAMRDHPNERSGAWSLFALSRRFSAEINNDIEDKALAEKIFNSYNKTINAYLRVVGYKLYTEGIERKTPGRNDGVDMEHFAYMCDACYLLSHDINQNKTAKGIGIRLWEYDVT